MYQYHHYTCEFLARYEVASPLKMIENHLHEFTTIQTVELVMKINNACVSVIIPAYNRGNYLRQTIDSVLNQSYGEIELIVVDDGSTDNTMNILLEYGSKLITLSHDDRLNKGQSASINLGLKKAKGDYIAILDSDDYWDSLKIEKQVDHLEKNPAIGLVYCNGKVVDENGNVLSDIYTSSHTEYNRPEDVLVDCYFLLPNNALVRREVFEKAGLFDENLRAAKDHDMAIRLAEMTNIAYFDEYVFFYRRHSQSISVKNAQLRWKNGFVILDKARGRYPYSKSIVSKRRAVLHFRLFQCELEDKNYFSSLKHLLLAGIYDPLRGIKVLSGIEPITSPH